jgi:hypothetical protein
MLQQFSFRFLLFFFLVTILCFVADDEHKKVFMFSDSMISKIIAEWTAATIVMNETNERADLTEHTVPHQVDVFLGLSGNNKLQQMLDELGLSDEMLFYRKVLQDQRRIDFHKIQSQLNEDQIQKCACVSL